MQYLTITSKEYIFIAATDMYLIIDKNAKLGAKALPHCLEIEGQK